MMNEDKQFEQRLCRQPMREVPPAWRAEILAAARAAQPVPQVVRAGHRSVLSTINTQLLTLLWPHPKAWAGLAAVWVVIIALHLFNPGIQTPQVAERSVQLNPQVVAQLKEQRRLFAELAGVADVREADRHRETPNRPRTQRVEILAA
jgi:hypothetical protein